MSNSGVPDMLLTWQFWTVLLYMCVHPDHRAEWTSLVCNICNRHGNHLLITLCLVCSTIMVKFYEKLWLLKKITNYWHLNFLLQIAPKRGWHLCSINTGPYGENTEIYSSLKLLHWLNLNCASIIGRSTFLKCFNF
jgi:hypothetical protein